MKVNNFLKFIISVGVAESAGIIGSVFTVSAIPTWYATLQRPALSPPNWVFGPVWTALYFLMGISLFLIWKKHSNILENVRMFKGAVAVFFVQLILNTLWSVIFFGFHNPGLAFLEIIILWLAIIWTIVSFYKISRTAALLLLPYILWVTFAGYLNLMIWVLN